MDSLLLDKYEILRVLGQGGMGTVYEAREAGSGRRVAIKWMHTRPFTQDDPDLLRFKQEARIAGTLDSPNVTAVLELARDPKTDIVFQVMELLEGEDLRSLVERVGPLAPDVALRITAQACSGLAAAHAADVVHRDIKPENLFLARKGDGEVVVKLLDFGIAKIRRSHGDASGSGGRSAPPVPMTTTGQMLGTPLYMAPEQIDAAKHADARSDVYSMGVTLYTILTGAPPRAHIKSLMQLVHAILTEPVPPLADRAPWVRPEVVAILEKAMHADREARYANGAELAAELTQLLPGGTALREEMLVGIGDEQRKVAAASAETQRRAETATARGKPVEAALRERRSLPRWALWAALVAVMAGGIVAGMFVVGQ
ncbi:serine/threonine-protein kinase [Polyangium sp. 15x6]|uniref:serine/threonine-protein kinase n=1 Tax=Polyangium sp. 15x6 TaxID=3042687 RepID=UPI00249BBFED|nr:serine/threonine-protein kinase [Polyangium sp. 15x6]MDI3287800.1 serine/threonine-protein kinase [Polyangium sp. 15x6]